MEEGTKSKKTVFIGGVADDVDEGILYESFSTFVSHLTILLEAKHRGFAFITYSSSADAQDAIDNMDMNELRGKVLKTYEDTAATGWQQGWHVFAQSPPILVFIFAKYGNPKSG
ncbi:hypothetical protein C0995_003722 [Termitomyces sp. Mi166|nr:hypothetical protein C0995_003722 [Termitomyces sp. Mi166\